jgi:hypothetical protein
MKEIVRPFLVAVRLLRPRAGLNPNLLGVSRDCELEAHQPDVRYARNTGYEPSGFILVH